MFYSYRFICKFECCFLFSVYPLNDSLFFGSIRGKGLNNSVSDDDSEDSNAENNWKNDYPDEDDLESINEDDMVCCSLYRYTHI